MTNVLLTHDDRADEKVTSREIAVELALRARLVTAIASLRLAQWLHLLAPRPVARPQRALDRRRSLAAHRAGPWASHPPVHVLLHATRSTSITIIRRSIWTG